jgi:hypothetical protein
MFWVIRWTDKQHGHMTIVVEAGSRAEAEYMGLRRGIPIGYLGMASRADVAKAERAGLLWRYTRTSRYTCFGRPVTRRHIAALIIAGVATAMLHLGPIVAPMLY